MKKLSFGCVAILIGLASPSFAQKKGAEGQWTAGPKHAPIAGKDPKVTFGKDAVTLQNRGSVVSNESYPKGATLSCLWKWTKGVEEGKYHDSLAICLRTDGKLKEQWSHEIKEAVVVRFEPAGGSIIVTKEKEGDETEVYFRKDDTFKIKMEKGTEYALKIVDRKDAIEVYFDGKLVYKGKLPAKSRNYRWAIYNREGVANVFHESVLRELKIAPNKK